MRTSDQIKEAILLPIRAHDEVALYKQYLHDLNELKVDNTFDIQFYKVIDSKWRYAINEIIKEYGNDNWITTNYFRDVAIYNLTKSDVKEQLGKFKYNQMLFYFKNKLGWDIEKLSKSNYCPALKDLINRVENNL